MTDRLFDHQPVTPPDTPEVPQLAHRYVRIAKRRLPEARTVLAEARDRNPWRF